MRRHQPQRADQRLRELARSIVPGARRRPKAKTAPLDRVGDSKAHHGIQTPGTATEVIRASSLYQKGSIQPATTTRSGARRPPPTVPPRVQAELRAAVHDEWTRERGRARFLAETQQSGIMGDAAADIQLKCERDVIFRMLKSQQNRDMDRYVHSHHRANTRRSARHWGSPELAQDGESFATHKAAAMVLCLHLGCRRSIIDAAMVEAVFRSMNGIISVQEVYFPRPRASQFRQIYVRYLFLKSVWPHAAASHAQRVEAYLLTTSSRVTFQRARLLNATNPDDLNEVMPALANRAMSGGERILTGIAEVDSRVGAHANETYVRDAIRMQFVGVSVSPSSVRQLAREKQLSVQREAAARGEAPHVVSRATARECHLASRNPVSASTSRQTWSWPSDVVPGGDPDFFEPWEWVSIPRRRRRRHGGGAELSWNLLTS